MSFKWGILLTGLVLLGVSFIAVFTVFDGPNNRV